MDYTSLALFELTPIVRSHFSTMFFKDYVENLKKQQRTTNLMELRKEIERGKLTKNTKTKIQNF